MRQTVTLGATLGTIVALLAGCGGDAPAEVTTRLSVTGTDRLEFQPAAFTVPANQQIPLEFTAGETVEHDFIIAGAADVGEAGGVQPHGDEGSPVESDDLEVAHAPAGQTVTATFSIDQPGTYEVYCSVPGHREAGMVATLSVVAGG